LWPFPPYSRQFPMLTPMVSTALRFRVLVVAVAALMIVFGIRAVQYAPLDVFPEFAPPLVEIQTEAHSFPSCLAPRQLDRTD
jgi:Cu/Ag efflux pump CusA